MGEHSFSQSLINIDTDHSREEILNTMIHEIFHACYRQMDLDEHTEEKIVTCMANIFTQVVQDNPDFLNYLTKMSKGD